MSVDPSSGRPHAGPLLRRAQEADADAIARVHHRCWQQTYAGLVPESRLGPAALGRRQLQWRRRLGGARPEGEQILVGLGGDGEVVGWAAAGPARVGHRPVAHHARGAEPAGLPAEEGVEPPPAPWELQGLYVLRAHHGSGLGQALFDALGPPPAAFLWVARDNPRARAFYRRNGFVEDGTIVVEEHLGDLVTMRMVRGAP